MALRVWLPLRGDLKNQGLSDIQFSTLATNTSVDSAGKIGQCYKNNSATAGGLRSNTQISLGNQHSMFCWFKFTSLTSASSLGGGLISQHRYSTSAGTGITIKYVSSTTGYLSVNTGNGSSRTFNTYCGTTLLQANKWYHGGFTYDGENIRIYVNGVCEKTQAYPNMLMPSEYLTVFCWSLNGSSGNEVHANYKLIGSINDVRVYDHCLSQKEVKEISKALVLNYKFSYLSINNSNTIITEPDGSKWAHVVHHNNPGGGVFASTDDFVGGVYKDANRWFKFYNVVTGLTSFEFMVKQKTTSSASEVKYRWIQNVSPIGATYEQVAPAQVTRITTNGYTNGTFGGLYVTNSNAHLCIANATKGNWYGAFGSWTAYQSGTPGYPNTVVTTGYMDLYVRVYDELILYDCSGYENNGIINGSPSLSMDSARYDGSMYLENGVSGNVISPTMQLPGDAITINIWVKSTNKDAIGAYHEPFASYNGGYYEMSIHNSGYLRAGLFIGGTRYVTNSTVNNLLDGNWHMITETYDGATIRRYIDGVQENTTSVTGTLNGTSQSFYFGKYGTNDSYGCKQMYLSDARVYTTALSADDVMELYHTPASIDNKGNFYCGEFKEQ